MADLTPGSIFAGHRIEGIAGRGGMGTVYRATHLALDHVVALKVISGDLAADESFQARFVSESRVAVSLRHPNVVPIHHAGEEDGLLFVTMDLIAGPDLRRLLLANGPLQPERAAKLIAQVAAALDVAHARGLVHRDIKPGNVLVEQRGEGEHAYLTDFGLAKRFDQATDVSGLTGTGAFVGTLDYVAPEQIRGDRVDARTDVYALGCVLYETMSGRAPFAEREENVAKIYAHLQDEPPWLPGDVDDELDEVVARAMAKEPRDRFPSAGDLARAATAAASGVISRVDERSVATGKAAPATPATTIETPPPPPPPPATTVADATAATVPAATEAVPPPPPRTPTSTSRRDGPPRWLLLLGALGALALVTVLLSTLGTEEGSPDVSTTVTEGVEDSPPAAAPAEFNDPVAVDGMPIGLFIRDNQVTVATRLGNSIVSVDKQTRRAGTPIGLSGQGEDVAVVGDFAYVTMPLEGAVAKVDLAGGVQVTEIPVGLGPRGIVAADGSLWVANEGSSEISQIDVATGVVTPILLEAGTTPADIAFDGTELWISDRDGDQVIRREIEGDGEKAFPVGDNPKGIVIFEDQVWVANADDGSVSRVGLDGSPGGTVDVGGTPRGLASGFGRIWVANGNGYVSAIDSSGGEPQRVDLEGSPEEITEGPELMWVTTGSGDSLASIDPDPTDDEPSSAE